MCQLAKCVGFICLGKRKRFLPQLQNAFYVCEKEKDWNVASLGLFLIIKSSDFLGNQGKNQAQTSKRTTVP